MPTKKDAQNFTEYVVGEALLEGSILSRTIDWIGDNIKPDEVYQPDVLVTWIKDNRQPEDVFDESDLEAWAIENGFVKQ